MEVYHCAKKGNLKQHTAFCSNWTLFIQTKCLKGRQEKDITWQSLSLKDYLELYTWTSRGDTWWHMTTRIHKPYVSLKQEMPKGQPKELQANLSHFNGFWGEN